MHMCVHTLFVNNTKADFNPILEQFILNGFVGKPHILQHTTVLPKPSQFARAPTTAEIVVVWAPNHHKEIVVVWLQNATIIVMVWVPKPP